MMTIRKKSLDTLKQQKNSFFNFINTREKYASIIADLFYDGEIEKIDDVAEVESYLVQKWISKNLIDSLKKDYISYLRDQNYYWSMDDYPEIEESIEQNDKNLKKFKKNILKNYKDYEKFVSFDVNEFVADNFIVPNVSQFEWPFDYYYWQNQENEKIKEKRKLKEYIEKIEKEMNKMKNQKKQTRGVLFRKINDLKKTLQIKNNEKKLKEEELDNLEKMIDDFQDKKNLCLKIDKINSWDEFNVSEIMWKCNYSDIDQCKQAMQNVCNELYKQLWEKYFDYIPEGVIEKIRRYIVGIIENYLDKEKNNLKLELEWFVRKYLNYFFNWEDKSIHSLQYKTIYSKSRIDPEIMDVINKLWMEINFRKAFDDDLDYDFVDDVFIHTTGFGVLGEILEEWWLVSTNEIMKRSRYNQNIMDARTQKNAHHKDVYFSRWFRKNSYWHPKIDDDYVFIANTMSNFAGRWYGIPLSDKMQPNAWLDDVNASHDVRWYSIISNSVLKKDFWDNSYSKINVQDFYIFVSESKRKEIESDPKYKISNANIIYFPERYKWKMSYELYEFIKHEIFLREEWQSKKMPIPRKIVIESDGIKSIGSWYRWAFCDLVSDTSEVLFNPLKNCNSESLIDFLIVNQNDFGLSRLKIDFDELRNFMSEQMDKINDVKMPFEYPKELLLLAVLCVRLWLWNSYEIILCNIKNKLKTFGYDVRNLWIFCKTVEWMWDIFNPDYRRNYQQFKISMNKIIKVRCVDWSVDFAKLKKFLVKISKLSLSSKMSDEVKGLFS